MKNISDMLKLLHQQEDKILKAAEIVADCVQSDGYIYASGTGHSHILAEEIFYRAGGFARVIPLLDEGLMLHKSATGSTKLERDADYGKKFISQFDMSKNDVFIIASNSGRNTVSIDMALYAKNKGAKVILITSIEHSSKVESRHSSGLKLYEIAHIYLDNMGCFGDASITLSGLETRVGATSTIMGTLIIQAIMVEACDHLLKKGIVPEVFSSSNTEKGELDNEKLIVKYQEYITSL